MSVESAKAFLGRLKNDEDFHKAVGEIATKEERMGYITNEGYDFTKGEIDILRLTIGDEELEDVNGWRRGGRGVFCCYCDGKQ